MDATQLHISLLASHCFQKRLVGFTQTATSTYITGGLISAEGQDGEEEEVEQRLGSNAMDRTSGINIWVENVVYRSFRYSAWRAAMGFRVVNSSHLSRSQRYIEACDRMWSLLDDNCRLR